MDRQYYSLEEAGQILGVKRWRAWEMAKQGVIPHVRLGRRIFVPKRAMDAMIDEAIDEARQVRQRAG